ncbi:MAG: bifunctional UDP-N-acetylglucosamine diphosphorylase/glucosamine-1-phosphate N-acetyltransferase GlmU [Armatimonadota bacterium]|nr:bifunctional UDP-N-acetylglucosamine diphosphorylase/glucosamine-1-phosphate N-acetyltransferase GlmU [Armatimonadota bacterium]MDR7451373.1 bifunctional UDP-N-acetylglucosamine diphosphorylase/glucosamine-1-phosphate N-acetyltransferase GlmU [Armatimonadota bacterium]MDR7466477.1 bifunctional UDP-N-acetylglucosamine diphosphorylase/glucosamine-1-phosphate N-acetyltransferase GlmU [Armatimonadota bacterium]MDR7493199.1 bifunctional UDP-N-acetylglucosamine diphosphorylase/glucosamine-1-phospha
MGQARAVVLAAGQGKRMRSDLPKVLHTLCGQPLLSHVLDALEGAGLSRPVVVIGHGADSVRTVVGTRGECVEQREPLGTGHAVMQAVPLLDAGDGPILILYGDTPLLRSATITALLERHRSSGAAATILTAHLADPAGYGRVLRAPDGSVARIVEEADASAGDAGVREINAGSYVFEPEALREALTHLRPDNAQGEYYLTDTVAWLLGAGRKVSALPAPAEEAMGVNSRRDLAAAEAVMRRRVLDRLMDEGVTIVDPATTYVHVGVVVGPDTVIHPQTYLEGKTTIGRACVIGPQARLQDSRVGDRVVIEASTVVGSEIGEGSRVGPYSRLRPGSRIGRFVEIGNYAEIKNSTIGDYTKVHHMSYIGDATLGARVNIGAGTVTCNYDGRRKHQTVIEDEAFIGSDSMLIAPVRVGRGAVTGAGSVVNRDVPPGGVAVGVPARVIRYVSTDAAR